MTYSGNCAWRSSICSAEKGGVLSPRVGARSAMIAASPPEQDSVTISTPVNGGARSRTFSVSSRRFSELTRMTPSRSKNASCKTSEPVSELVWLLDCLALASVRPTFITTIGTPLCIARSAALANRSISSMPSMYIPIAVTRSSSSNAST